MFEKDKIIEDLFVEFNHGLRGTGKPDFRILERCPAEFRDELRALMNVATLAYWALNSEEGEKEDSVPLAI